MERPLLAYRAPNTDNAKVLSYPMRYRDLCNLEEKEGDECRRELQEVENFCTVVCHIANNEQRQYL
jgi:hypothetical protein